MVLTGQNLYDFTSNLLLGYKMDLTTFYWLLNLSKRERELQRPWVQLRTEDSGQNASPTQNTINNSMYLTPLNLPTDFCRWYSPNRSIIGVATDGISFKWYKEIPLERKHEYKDDNSKYYINLGSGQIFLCGILDQNYVIHQFYIKNSADITSTTSWVFPGDYAPILAFDVAKKYREMFDYDVVNVQQGEMISNGAKVLFAAMSEWDSALQESQVEGVDYGNGGENSEFRGNVVRG